ncbi:MAG TPA: hypothetical protein VLM76_01690 [Patescibacteria group bacterium]|nr:hypothetical protein [Patescibacteria group bacterium]
MTGAVPGAPAGETFAGEIGAPAGETVVVLADDLIWATRLVGQLRTLGAVPVRTGSVDSFAAVLAAGGASRVVVDLTARAYDGVAMTRRATEAGLRVLCVGQHDDAALRRAVLAAGAEQVHAYRKLFEDGHAVLAAWLGVPAPAPGTLVVPAPAGPTEDPGA